MVTFPDFGSRVFYFPMAPSQGGERAERLTNTLFGAKAGGRHCQERALGLTSLRCTRRRCALATLSYDNMVPGRIKLFACANRPRAKDLRGKSPIQVQRQTSVDKING